MSFLKDMEAVLNEDYNNSTTENGAVGYRTTGKALLDFNFKVASYRNKNGVEIVNDFMKVFYEDKLTAMKFLFFIRDREEGLGERRVFRVIIAELASVEPEIIKAIMPLVAEYGRYDDLLELFNTPLEKDVIELFKEQIDNDAKNFRNKKPVSLLAKWLPSINASEKQKVRAKKIIKQWGITEEFYRKTLSKLRQYIDVTERKMCANEWDQIKYENVPSRANLNYNAAFLRHDEERRRAFLGQVEKGEKKIHAGKLYPHDIVHKYTDVYSWNRKLYPLDTALEQLWKALPQKEIANTLVVADGSGSMTSTIGKTNVTALDVANALAIYFAEHNKGEFNNTYITFSENPQLVRFNKADSLHDKIAKALAHNEVANTNIEKVFGLILKTAIDNKLSQEEMPKNILIISDMEFDECAAITKDTNDWGIGRIVNRPTKKLFKVIENEYNGYGYKLPKLIFWNVASRTGTIPMKENDLGVALVSGFSTNIAEMVMNDKLDPLEILLDKLNTPRYEKITKILQKLLQ